VNQRIIAIIDSPQEAREAARGLEEEGFARDAITVMSAEPLTGFTEELAVHSPGRAGLVSIAGGLAGAIAGIALTVWTARSMGLVTGGMPVATPWAFGIIVFELIALGAILATFVTTLGEAGLFKKSPAPEIDSAIAEGKVALSVSCPTEARRQIAESVFSRFGAVIREGD
jgi:hypothetical protein